MNGFTYTIDSPYFVPGFGEFGSIGTLSQRPGSVFGFFIRKRYRSSSAISPSESKQQSTPDSATEDDYLVSFDHRCSVSRSTRWSRGFLFRSYLAPGQGLVAEHIGVIGYIEVIVFCRHCASEQYCLRLVDRSDSVTESTLWVVAYYWQIFHFKLGNQV